MPQEKPKKKLVKINKTVTVFQKPELKMKRTLTPKPELKMKRTLTPMMKKTPKSLYRVSEPLGKSPTPSSDPF